jgi:hypothetical protein
LTLSIAQTVNVARACRIGHDTEVLRANRLWSANGTTFNVRLTTLTDACSPVGICDRLLPVMVSLIRPIPFTKLLEMVIPTIFSSVKLHTRKSAEFAEKTFNNRGPDLHHPSGP